MLDCVSSRALPDYGLAGQPMKRFLYVYVLVSESDASKHYTGITRELFKSRSLISTSRQRAFYRVSQILRFPAAPIVKEEDSRSFVDHMRMDRNDIDASAA